MYHQPQSSTWTGRIDSRTDPLSFRFHQRVQLKNIDELEKMTGGKAFALLGFQCDEGVKRNKGRVGAYYGPVEVKKALANLPWHFSDETFVFDVGNVGCEDHHLEQSQQQLGEAVQHLIQHHITPIIIGGGHETAYGHYLGVRQAAGTEKSIGIINIDAHFDMRPYDQGASSGTMFRQILDADRQAGYLCLGIQPFGNTATLFETAQRYGCVYVLEEQVTWERIKEIYTTIEQFIEKYDVVMLTLCMDAISASAAPGVSAPSPFGLDPKIARALIRQIVAHPKTTSFDISEVNPTVDENRKTITLAAYLCAEALAGFERRNSIEIAQNY
ncbi:formimidoylglutamase [Anoxybacillus sp. UARK-01]|uniref:Formimidoylglutamase n=1 Tax=Anoxybacteroides rupiense TaxID=311460 RepID=A0ABD5IX71_9BACL|nr:MULTISPECIES: formimidoylglutamase [Anoxybacillus]MBB3908529.1 formiminoglutamase [Anoxybacillus rupiensis]MED5052957.1 formimidoylglutamase [Anoxybacillus rupiensis]OQM44681.1 formimidoylglutamase [Anoxybacillus sp. UARK-01]